MKDKIHYAIRRAFKKDDWIVKNDPFKLKLSNTTLRVDLELEKIIEIEKDRENILVEIKSLD